MNSQIQPFNKKINLVKQSLKSTIDKFSLKPENYFYEEEVRSLLYNTLFNKFEEAGIVIKLMGNDYFIEHKDELINPVKAEYGKDSGFYSKYEISNIDIAILSEESFLKEKINDYQRYCDIVIEVKYSTEMLDSQHAGFVGDIEKIKSAKKGENFLGIALCFDLFENEGSKDSKFINDYKKKNIIFRNINTNEFVFKSGNCYAIYVAREKTFISDPIT